MRSLLVVLLFAVVYGSQINALVTDCVWGENPDCTEPWATGWKDVWVTMPSAPPCSVLVRVYYNARCLQIEIQDIAVSLIVTSPSGCATKAAISAFINTTSFKNQVTENILLQLTRDFYIRTGKSPEPCPEQTSATVGKLNNCRQMTVTYSFPGGTTIDALYDPLNPWLYYETLYSETGGVPVSIGLTSCYTTACCFRTLSHCIDSNGNLLYTFGPWTSSGMCPPFSPCKYLFCN